jgi:hypothetical protein
MLYVREFAADTLNGLGRGIMSSGSFVLFYLFRLDDGDR